MNTVVAIIFGVVHILRVRKETEKLKDNAVRPSEAFLYVVLAAAAALAGMYRVVLKLKD